MDINDDFAKIHAEAGIISLKIADLLSANGIGNLPPRQLVIGMYLAASSMLLTTYPDATDADKRALSEIGVVTQLALGAMEDALQRLSGELAALRSERN